MNRNKLIERLNEYEHLDDVIVCDNFNKKVYSKINFGTRFDDDKSRLMLVINDKQIEHYCKEMKNEDPLDLIKIYKTNIENNWCFEKDYTDGDISISIKYCPFCGEELK